MQENRELILEKHFIKVIITNIPENITLCLVGRHIRLTEHDKSSLIRSLNILPNISCSISFETSDDIYVYNKFASNVVYNTKIYISCNKQTNFYILPSIWPKDDCNIYVTQYSNTNFVIESNIFPFHIFTGKKTLSTTLVVATKSITFPYNFECPRTLKFMSRPYESKFTANFLDFEQKFNDTLLDYPSEEIKFGRYKSFGMISISKTNLFIDRLEMKENSQIIARNITVGHIEYYSIQNDRFLLSGEFIEIIHGSIFTDSFDNDMEVLLANYSTDFNITNLEWYLKYNDTYFDIIFDHSEPNTLVLRAKSEIAKGFESVNIKIAENENSTNLDEFLNYKLPFYINNLNINITQYYDQEIPINIHSVVQNLQIRTIYNQKLSLSLEYIVKSATLYNVDLISISGSVTGLGFFNSIIRDSVSMFCPQINLYNTSHGKSDIRSTYLYLTFSGITAYINDAVLSIQNNIFNISKFEKIILTCDRCKVIYNRTNNNFMMQGSYSLTSLSKLDSFSVIKSRMSFNITKPLKYLELSSYLIIPSLESSNILSNQSTVVINKYGIINTSLNLNYSIKNLVLNSYSYANLKNVVFRPEIFNLSSASQQTIPGTSCKILSINTDTLASIDYVEGVENVDIFYSIVKSGYLHAGRFSATKNLHVRLYYFDDTDPVFYNSDCDDFSVELLCSSNFSSESLSFEFISSHWAFNSSTRLFDIALKNNGNETCISIIPKEDEDDVLSKKKIILLVCAVTGILLITVAILIIVLIRIKRKKKEIDRFMMTDLQVSIL